MAFYNHFVLLFGATLTAFILLILVTLSTPLIKSLYFLEVTLSSGTVKFGVLGYCEKTCSATGFGYHFGTEITTTVSTTLVLFPAAAGLSLLLALAFFPLICGPRAYIPHVILSLLSLFASACSIAAFIVGVYLAASAESGFKTAGDTTSFGAAVWMSLVSAVLLTLVGVNVALGTCFGNRLGRKPTYDL
ncbi:hypothetical protein DAEQUDRAFT_729057 [Daedalea quercina L-15889]|uniref:Pali-domain-containing protein n=1 Tax=Daedalea quercina L-15889 TaxID=1314783 RepID=A0A165NV94_9APHY|nr:hypothetical protein DAEQUDRAFT_729057 [Daedalea quercina L-15889]